MRAGEEVCACVGVAERGIVCGCVCVRVCVAGLAKVGEASQASDPIRNQSQSDARLLSPFVLFSY